MSLRAGLAILIIGAMLLGAAPALAQDPTGSSPGEAIQLAGIKSGTLAPGQEIWYQFWDPGTNRPLGVTLRFAPSDLPGNTERNPLVNFEVWTYEKRGLQSEFIQIGAGTQSGQPQGLMYWRGGSNVTRNYYYRVFNNTPDIAIRYAIAFTGEQFNPPWLEIPAAAEGPPPAMPTPPVAPAPTAPPPSPPGAMAGGKTIQEAVDISGVMSGIITAEHQWYKFYQPTGGRATGVVLNFAPEDLETIEQKVIVSFRVWVYKCPVQGKSEDIIGVPGTLNCGYQVIGQGTRSGQPIGVNYWRHTAPEGVYYIEVFNNSGQPAGYSLALTGDTYPPPRFPVPVP